jgi:integrase
LATAWYEGKQKRVRPWTARGYRDALDHIWLPLFSSWKIGAVGADEIAHAVRGLEAEGLRYVDPDRPRRPLSPSSIVNALKPLTQTLALAVRRKLIGTNPVKTLTSDKRPRQAEPRAVFEWSDEQISKLLVASAQLCERPEARHDHTLLLKLAIYCGPRLGELLGLCWRCVDFDGAVMVIEQQHTILRTVTEPKTRHGVRRIPLTRSIVTLLKAHKARAFAVGHAKPDDFVFCWRDGRPLQRRLVQQHFGRARDLAGLPGSVRFHDLRHCFVSVAVARGVPAHVVSATAGHSDLNTTLGTYQHLFSREAAEQAFREAMDAASGGEA